VGKARMYYTGVQRSATAVLKSQDSATRNHRSRDHERVVDSLMHIKEIGLRIRKAFEEHDLDTFGLLMDEHWQYKRQMSPAIGLSLLDQLYEQVKSDFGVLGGKIIGAGGGGFLMLYCPEQGRALDEFMAKRNMPPVSYFPSLQGSKVVSDFTPHDDFDHP
jgi:D-glycero-alpha-D-manno-heptose-7-phosphate kinase